MAAQTPAKPRTSRSKTVPVGETSLPKGIGGAAKAKTKAGQTEAGTQISQLTSYLNKDLRSLRSSSVPTEAVRILARMNGTVSAAVFSFVQVANTDHKILAYDSVTHEFSMEGSLLAQSILARFDTLYDYSEGFGDKQSLGSLKETLLREAVLTGADAAELVLDKQRLPDRLNVIAYETLRMVSDGKGGRYPEQQTSGDPIKLDIPTFFVAESNREAAYAYVFSMLEAAIEDAYIYNGFLQDMVRAVRRSGGNRLVVTLDTAKVIGTMNAAERNDPKKVKAYLEANLATFTSIINALEPEDALVVYDTGKAELLDSKGDKADYTYLMNALSGNLATSLKTSPSILGLRINGSQSLSNTESLVFLKVAAALHLPVETVLSRALTLACRLYGLDVYVNFKFEPIDLRPELELEAFKTMKQARVIEQWGLGLLSDDQAAMILTGKPRAPGAPALSGTMFHKKSGATSTDMASKASPNNGAQEQAMQPDTTDATPANKGASR